MYIIAAIKDGVVHAKEDYITPSLILTRIKLNRLKENGYKHLKIYEITDLKEVVE